MAKISLPEEPKMLNANRKDWGRHKRLLADPDVKRWYDNIVRGSAITADVRLRRPPFTSFWHLSFTELYDTFAILDMTETMTPLCPPDDSKSRMFKTIPSSERYFGF
jgi:hypothetical protein